MHRYVAVDQYGTHIPIKNHPRRELCDFHDVREAQKIYCHTYSGARRYIGYIVDGHWYRIHQIIFKTATRAEP